MTWQCVQARELWDNIQNFLNILDIHQVFTLKQVLFGFLDEEMDSIKNTIILFTKGYIWKTKHEQSPLLFTSWKKYLKVKLEDLRAAYEYLNELLSFDQWSNVYALL